MNNRITSALVAPVRVVGSSIIIEPAAALPSRALGLGPYAVVQGSNGLPRLVDGGGQVFGVFVNEQLARQTAGALSQ